MQFAHRAEDDHRHLGTLPADPPQCVEGAGLPRRGDAQQADLRAAADQQVEGRAGRRADREHPVAAQLQGGGERLGEQPVVVDHHEPNAHGDLQSDPAALPAVAPAPHRPPAVPPGRPRAGVVHRGSL